MQGAGKAEMGNESVWRRGVSVPKKPFPHIPQGPQRSRPPQGHPPQPPNEVERPQQHRRPSTGASATSAIVSIPAALGQDTLAAGVRTSRYMRILIHRDRRSMMQSRRGWMCMRKQSIKVTATRLLGGGAK